MAPDAPVPGDGKQAVKPAPFDYARPDTVEEAVALLSDMEGEARILAGGQSLIAMLNSRIASPQWLIDITRIPALLEVREDGDALTIGAAVTQASLENWPDLDKSLPLVSMALPHVGHFQTRSKGTVCGSIAHGDPSSELPLCLAVLDGTVSLRGPKGRRSVAGRSFHTGVLSSLCGPDELIESITLPTARHTERFSFHEIALRHGDFAIVAVAVAADDSHITIGVGGADDHPAVRVWQHEDIATERALDDHLNALAWDLDCTADSHASATYRRHMIRHLGRLAIGEVRR